MRAQADAKNWNQLIRHIGANFDIINMAPSDSDFCDVEASAEVDDGERIVNEGLPSGSERDLIEYYFNRGLERPSQNNLIWFSDAVLLFVVEWRQNTLLSNSLIIL